MKKTIEELTEAKTYFKRDRDAFGNRTKEPYEANIKRKVQLVTGWERFGHYMIDLVIIIGISLIFNLVWVQVFHTPFTSSTRTNGLIYNLIPSLDNIIITVGFYFICEQTMQRTIGKFATNSVVINQYAEAPNPESLIGRSFTRLVPFESLSCLSDRGWHDKWSKTYVVKTHERDRLKKLLNEQQGVFISDSEDLLD